MRLRSACLLLLLCPVPALGQTKIESNIGLEKYPAPRCAVPPPVDPALKPPPPSDTPNEGEAAYYNAKVRAYNNAMRAHNDGVKAYADCVQGYIAAGKADIARIQAAVDSAVATANGQ